MIIPSCWFLVPWGTRVTRVMAEGMEDKVKGRKEIWKVLHDLLQWKVLHNLLLWKVIRVIEGLLQKLNYYGIRNLLPWFKDFLSGRTQKVVIDGVKSRLIEVLSGIGQGTVTAGLLFLIFINHLPECVTYRRGVRSGLNMTATRGKNSDGHKNDGNQYSDGSTCCHTSYWHDALARLTFRHPWMKLFQ